MKTGKQNKNVFFLVITLIVVFACGFMVTSCARDTSNNVKVKETTKKITKKKVKKDDTKKRAEFVPSVPENKKPVADSYFDDACFIGDSRSEGLKIFGDIHNATYYTDVGMNVDKATNEACLFVNGQQMTLFQALDLAQFKKIYIMLGINEINWPYPDEFIKRYTDLINSIKAKQPNAIIYVEAIMPVGANNVSGIDNNKIVEMNKLIYEMCKKNQWYYLDMFNTLKGPDGLLPAEYSSEGVHLNEEGIKKWTQILRVHAIKN